MRTLPIRWTIGLKLQLLVVITVLPAFIIGGALYLMDDYHTDWATMHDKASDEAQDVASRADQFIVGTGQVLAALSEVSEVRSGNPQQTGVLLSRLLPEYRYYDNLIALNAEGVAYGSGGPLQSIPTNSANEPFFTMTVVKGSLTVVATHLDSPNVNDRAIIFAYPIQESPGSNRRGVVAATITPRSLQNFLLAETPAGASVTVVDAAGQIIARTPDREAWTGMRIDLSSISPALALRNDGVWEGKFLDNTPRVVAYHRAVRAPWQILVGIPQTAAYAPVVRSLWRGFLVVAIVFGFAMFVAVYFGRRLTRPLRRLAETAGAVVVGDRLPDPVVVQGEDEVADVSVAFNKMLTDLRRQVEQLSAMQAVQEADRLKSELLASVSHELKTPLGSIKGFASALQQEDVALDRATQLDFLATIEADADRLTRLVEDVLDMSRIEAGALRLRREPCSIGELIAATLGRLQGLIAEHTVQVALPIELPPVFVDPERIEQVLFNLVDNAIKYSPTGTSVRITASAALQDESSPRGIMAPKMVAVSVEDEGIGIPSEDLERVFERFWRADTGRRRRASGTGLGLAICKGIVVAHGGQIWAKNQPTAGCRVTFTVPRSRTESHLELDSGGLGSMYDGVGPQGFDLGSPFRGTLSRMDG